MRRRPRGRRPLLGSGPRTPSPPRARPGSLRSARARAPRPRRGHGSPQARMPVVVHAIEVARREMDHQLHCLGARGIRELGAAPRRGARAPPRGARAPARCRHRRRSAGRARSPRRPSVRSMLSSRDSRLSSKRPVAACAAASCHEKSKPLRVAAHRREAGSRRAPNQRAALPGARRAAAWPASRRTATAAMSPWRAECSTWWARVVAGAPRAASARAAAVDGRRSSTRARRPRKRRGARADGGSGTCAAPGST